MEPFYYFYPLFGTVGFVQAITLGTLLMVLNRPKYRSTLYLGLLLILFALGLVPRILDSLGTFERYPDLYLLPFDFFWFYFPIFYLYTQHACIFSNQKKKFWVLYPGIIVFFLQLYVFFLPYETKLNLVQTLAFDAYTLIKLSYGLGIGIYTLKLLNRHKVEVYNYFSFVKSKELNWSRIYMTFAIIGSLVYTILIRTIPDSHFARLFFLSFDLILIYWISYHGVQQRNVRSLLAKKKEFDLRRAKSIDESEGSSKHKKSMQELMQQIHEHMATSESYTHPELTVVDLAEKLNTHPKRISAAINSIENQNFNAYINSLRVKKMEKLLKNEEVDKLSIEGIGYEVGFHSKSAFYSAFKKFTGTTPSKYKEDMMAQHR